MTGCVLDGVVADNGEVWYDALHRTVHRTVHRIVHRILQDGVPLFLPPPSTTPTHDTFVAHQASMPRSTH